MTKSITHLLILLLLLPVAAGAQLSCGMPWPPENKRPDTITTFRITDLTIPVRQLPGVRATSDFSFKAKHFDLLWAPVSTRDIHEFIRSTVRGSDPKQPVDTLHCTLGTKDYIVITFSYDRKNKLLLYQDKQGSQDILLVTLKREKYRPEALQFLSDYLHEQTASFTCKYHLMKKRIRTWTLRITATALLIAGLLLIIVLYPALTYAHKAHYKDYTIYHNTAIDQHLGQRLEEATALVKRSAYYDHTLQTDICLDDGAVYPALVRRMGGPAFARGFYNKVVLMAPADWKHNYAALNGYRWNAAQLLAHEMIHCYQFRKLGLFHSNPIAGIPEWKWEGYPEYVARQYPDQQDLARNISRLLQTEQTEHHGWIQFADSTGTVLPYYENWLLMQYCMDIKKMTYDQVLADTSSQALIHQQMMRWFALQSTTHTR